MKNMKIAILLGAWIWVASSLAGCGLQTKAAETAADTAAETAYHKISGEEAKQMMDENEVTILDVRTAQEYAEGYIPNAVNLPNEEIGKEPPELLPEQDEILLVYCRSGRRSKEAADKLVAMGYTQVYDFGGIIDWTYDTVKGE